MKKEQGMQVSFYIPGLFTVLFLNSMCMPCISIGDGFSCQVYSNTSFVFIGNGWVDISWVIDTLI